MGLQILQRQTEVQNGLGTGADHHDGGVGQLLQIGRDVEGLLSAAMHAADAAGGEHLNACHVSDDHGGGDGGGTVLALGHQNGQVAAAGLGDGRAGLAQIVDLSLGQTGLQTAADDGDGGGHRAVFADDLLHVQRGLHILRVGHTVRDDGGLQRHHGAALVQSLLHFGSNVQILIERHVKFLHILNLKSVFCLKLVLFGKRDSLSQGVLAHGGVDGLGGLHGDDGGGQPRLRRVRQVRAL